MRKREPISVPRLEDVTEIWSPLNDVERRYLKMNAELKHYNKGELIHVEGEIPTHMMILVRGKVKIYKVGFGEKQQIMRMLKPCAFFGYRAIFADNAFHGYNTNARAFEDASVYLIPSDVISHLLSVNPTLSFHFVKILADELGASDARIVSLTQKHIRARLAESILFLKENYGVKEDGQTINVLISRNDIAALSNMTTSNAIRTLSTFASEGIIELSGSKIKILAEDNLVHINAMG